MTRDFSPQGEGGKPMLAGEEEQIVVEARRHGIVLVRAFLRAALLAAAGAGLFLVGWPLTPLAVVFLVLAAFVATTSVWRWDRTHVVLTTEKLFVESGVARRKTASVQLSRLGKLELEQSLTGRVLGYGTLLAGELEITYVPEAQRVAGLAARLAGG
jgi:uncharacterized membrane protein YdbT with pleckstrin-like domain